MACRLDGAPSHYLNQCWNIVNWTLRTNFNEISIGIKTFSAKKMHFKVSSAKWRPFFLDLNELRVNYIPNCSKCFLTEIICSAPNTSSMFCYVLVWFSINISQWNQIIHLTPFESIMTLLTMEYPHNSPISSAVMLKDVCKTYIYTNLHNVHNHWDIL